ncbi:MAG: virulence RhuM family protein, partial [Prevotellaceae bacterium]|nr:virulence RhuM family protein [Prevotellaceae bacterium]
MNKGEIIIYQAPDGATNLDVRLENESVWLTQRQIAHLFGTEIPAISKHIKNIVKSGELDEKATISKMEIIQMEGSRYITREVVHYNLDMILSVGYRVNSKNATQFRIWANRVLKDYLIKGYAINPKAKLEQLDDLKKTVKLLSNVIQHKELTADEATGL